MKKWDVIIIGSGISSLTSAALLSKKGKSVCVLEQHSKPGGYLHCFNRFRQRFDTGAHYVGAMDKGLPFHALLSYLEVFDDTLFTPLDEDGFDVLRFPEFEVQIPKSYEKLIPRLQAQFPQDREAVQKFFDMIRETSRRFPTYEFNDKPEMELLLPSLELRLGDVVRSLTKNPSLQSVFFAYCILHGVNPDDVSFGLHSIMVDSLIRGAYGFTRGGDALAENFVKRIKANGGEIHLKTKVKTIETSNRRVSAVITENGERFESDWVISGIHPKHTFQLLDNPACLTPAFRSRLGRIKETDGIFGIYAKCTAGTNQFSPLKNYYYMDGVDTKKMMAAGSPDVAPHTVFISPAGRESPETTALNIHAIAPHNWFEAWNQSKFGKRPDAYEKLKLTYANQVLDFVEGFEKGLRKSIEMYATSTPITNLHFNGSVEGSPYGIYHSVDNTGPRALSPQTHVTNLLITGQSILFPGLFGAAVAGLRSSGYIVGIKPVLRELQQLRATL
jgi:all-trans-retinol 13,14-reductase